MKPLDFSLCFNFYEIHFISYTHSESKTHIQIVSSYLIHNRSSICVYLFHSVQSLSRVWLFATPWTAARQASLSITNSQSLPKPMSIESVMPSNHLILCRPLLLPSIFPSIRVFSNESALRMRWPKYWSFSFNISPSNGEKWNSTMRMGPGTSEEAHPLRNSALSCCCSKILTKGRLWGALGKESLGEMRLLAESTVFGQFITVVRISVMLFWDKNSKSFWF